MHFFQVIDIGCWVRRRGPRLLQMGGLAAVFVCAGCHTGTLSDPNDVTTAGPATADVIMKQLQVASDALNERKDNKEINDLQFRILMTRIARGYINQATNKTITDANATTWGAVYVSARDWKDAEPALKQAVRVEKGPAAADFRILGQWIGDSLSLASAQAHFGKVHDAVLTARTVFTVPPKAKAPILTSILYDIVPAGYQHGDYIELADLLKDAIKQHQEVLVDPSTDGGRDFLLARPHHIQHAWEEIALLYSAAGKPDLARQAILESKLATMSSVKT